VIFTESNFNRIKENEVYLSNFSSYQNSTELNRYILDKLETDNLNILINNIIRIINIANGLEEDNSELEVKELILKVNLSINKENFKNILSISCDSDKKIKRIKRIFNESLSKNIDDKIEFLIKLEKLSELFYPNFSDKLILEEFKEEVQEEIEVERKKEKIDIKECYSHLTESQKDDLLHRLLKEKTFIEKAKILLKRQNFC
jgi:hypothetical protein